MRKYKPLTIDDLYNYCSSKMKNMNFSSKNDDSNLVVQINGTMNFEEDNHTEGLIPVFLKACHDGKNLNKCRISIDALKNALPSLSNRPILGFIRKTEDGEYNFAGHEIQVDDSGNLIYEEVPVGIINQSAERYIQKDQDNGRNYVFVSGYLFQEYSKAPEIIKKKEFCPVSVELTIKKATYSASEDILDLEDFFFSGVTILGIDDNGLEVYPAMEGSNIRLSDFKKQNNSIFSENEMLTILNELKTKLESFDFAINKNLKKGGNEDMKLDELLKKYNKTIDDIDFDYEGLSDEELEEKFIEEFGELPSEEKDDKEKFSKTFEISHEDIRSKLYELIVAVQAVDHSYYYIASVFDNYFVYTNDKDFYGQNYIVKEDDSIVFDGERFKLNVKFLTDEEVAILDEEKKCT